MAGLLDFLSSDDAQLGINLLAAGGPSTDPNASSIGARLGGAVNATRASQAANDEKALRRLYLQGQIAAQAQAAQDAADKRTNMQRYFGLLSGDFGPGAAAGGPQTPAAPMAGGAGSSAAPSGSNVAPSEAEAKRAAVTGRPVDISQLSPNQVAVLQALAKQSGMPDPVEVWKASKADWQVTDGYRWNKNATGNQEGFLPGVTVSASGQAIGREAGPDGRARVYLPEGASGALRTQARVQNEEQNRFTPGPDTIDQDPNSPTYLQKVTRSRLEQYGDGNGNGGGGGPAIGRGPSYAQERNLPAIVNAPDPAPVQAAIRERAALVRELPNATDPQSQAAMRYQISELDKVIASGGAGVQTATPQALIGAAPTPGGGGGSVNPPVPAIGPRPAAANVVELSPDQISTNAARAKGKELTVSADADRLKGMESAAQAGQQALQTASRLRQLAGSGIYEGGGAQAKTAIAGLVNGITGFTPKGLPGSEAFNAEASNLVLGQIKALGANPSNADRDFIMKTIPQITNSPQAREALIEFMETKAKSAIASHQRADAYFRKNQSFGGYNFYEEPAPAAGATPAAPAVGTVKGGYRFKGGDPSKPSSWEKQ